VQIEHRLVVAACQEATVKIAHTICCIQNTCLHPHVGLIVLIATPRTLRERQRCVEGGGEEELTLKSMRVTERGGMKCPNCQQVETKVIESRDVANGESIRRRRECLSCQYRYTTYERLERPCITIVKKDGTSQLYDRSKLVAGLQKACEKTTITGSQFEELVARIEKAIYDTGEQEVSSNRIGTIVMDALASENQIAYVRFASVYRNFSDIESFERELHRIKARIGVSESKHHTKNKTN
jgi:transcriptional repressor NrdR